MMREARTVICFILLAFTSIAPVIGFHAMAAPTIPSVEILNPFEGKYVWGFFSMRGSLSVPEGDKIVSLEWRDDNGPWSPINISTSWIINLGPFHPGTHKIEVRATNDTGFKCNDTVSVQVMNTAPTISLIEPVTDTHLFGNITVKGTAKDLEGPVTKGVLWIVVSGHIELMRDFNIVDGQFSMVVDVSSFMKGETRLEVSVSDSDNQVVSYQTRVFIGEDPTKPVQPPHHLNLTVLSPMNGSIIENIVNLSYNIDWAPDPNDHGDRWYPIYITVLVDGIQAYNYYAWQGNYSIYITIPKALKNFTMNVTVKEGGLVATKELQLKGNWTYTYSNGTSTVPPVQPPTKDPKKEDLTIWWAMIAILTIVLVAVVLFRIKR